MISRTSWEVNQNGWGVASERLSFTCLGKASQGKAKAKTGIGKSDLPELQGGPRKRDFGSIARVRAPRLYPDPLPGVETFARK